MTTSASEKLDLVETQTAFNDVNPHWIDVETLGAWLYTCDKNHESTCCTALTPADSIETRPQWLVDIRRKCLVPAGPNDRYAALSYVWGGVQCSQTTTTTLPRWLEPGSLEQPDVVLPRTIRHTIGLLELLGVPYLWVDALCIVQDDVDIKRKQIHAMAWIYASAYVTIIAADGWDANHGLRGVRNVTESRFLHGDSVREVEQSLKTQSAPWYNRGWTFQEMIFSRRRIMFHNQLVIWECPRAAWNECHLNSIFKILPWYIQLSSSAGPNVEQYMRAVCIYNTRQFTFPEDALKAISSLLSVWKRSFDGGFISGLPQMFFYEALLWQPGEPLKRRTFSNNASNDGQHLPSWSWAGWEGSIDIESWIKHFSHIHYLASRRHSCVKFQVTPTVEWSYCDPSHNGLVSIDASSLIYRPRRGAGFAAPQGWEQSPESTDIRPVWKYVGLEDTKAAYPLPLLGQHGNVTSASFLCGRTRRGRFNARRIPQTQCNDLTLLNQFSNSCGMLRPTCSLDTEFTDELTLELVEVAGGATWRERSVSEWGDFGEDSLQTGWGLSAASITYVMWIAWEDGVAYRLGLGRMLSVVWEFGHDGEIDLILG
ncbi:hypothetical protein OQA88_1083 [Cercophora sp. LCS_1]